MNRFVKEIQARLLINVGQRTKSRSAAGGMGYYILLTLKDKYMLCVFIFLSDIVLVFPRHIDQTYHMFHRLILKYFLKILA